MLRFSLFECSFCYFDVVLSCVMFVCDDVSFVYYTNSQRAGVCVCVCVCVYLTNKEAEAMYYTVIKHDGHLRTRRKCRKHSPAACVFFIS